MLARSRETVSRCDVPDIPDLPHVVEGAVTIAATSPRSEYRQYADRLAGQGFYVSMSTMQNVVVADGLGRRTQRLRARQRFTEMTTG